MVGTAGFEPTTSCAPCKCATRLRYVPTGADTLRDDKIDSRNGSKISREYMTKPGIRQEK